MTGTLWHEWMHNTLRRLGIPFMAEVNLTPWMPVGWGGTGDWLIWNPELKGFVLSDLKTTKGESMFFIERDGAKEEHRRQTSMYWHAAKDMGLPLVRKIGVLYMPMNDTRKKDDVIEPVLIDFDPIPKKELYGEARGRKRAVDSYVKSLPKPNPRPLELEEFVTDELAPEQERTQRLYFDRATETHDLKLVPHWSAAFCPFPDELCSCSAHGTTKIGFFESGDYYPRSGYEDIVPEIRPS